MKVLRFFFFIGLFPFSMQAQDAQFSQFFYSPVLTNPALTATQQNFTVNTIYRTQWYQVVDPYKTFQLSASYPLISSNNQRWGAAGISYVNSASGNGGFYKTNRIAGSFAYNLNLGKNHYMAAAIQGSYLNKAMNMSNLTTGSQWQNGSFNHSASLNETFNRTHFGAPVFDAGLVYYSVNKDTKNRKNYLGVAVQNLNHPQDGLYSFSKLPFRYTLTGGLTVFENTSWMIQPQALFVMQAKAIDMMGGADIFYKLSGTDPSKNGAIGGGIYYRYHDALIGRVELRMPSYSVGFSYDYTSSSLTKDLRSSGAAELYLAVFIPVKRKPIAEETNTKEVVREEIVQEDSIDQEDSIYYYEEEVIVKKIVVVKTYTTTDSTIIVPDIKVKTDDDLKEIDIEPVFKDSMLLITLDKDSNYTIDINKPGYFGEQLTVSGKDPDTVTTSVYMKEANEGASSILGNIVFEPNSSEIDNSSFKELDRLYEFLMENPSMKVEISGHTDDIGSEEDNRVLSQSRAQSVKYYLVGKGIPSRRILTKGYGETVPLVPNTDDAARSKNRRVEIKILKK